MESNDVQQRLRRVPGHLLAAQTEEAAVGGSIFKLFSIVSLLRYSYNF